MSNRRFAVWARTVTAALAVAVMVAACGTITTLHQNVPEIRCDAIPSAACQEQADALAQTAGGPVKKVDLTCSIAICTRAIGRGTATVTLVNGTLLDRTWSYTGDSNATPVPICVGLPRDVCVQQVKDSVDEISPKHLLVSVTVTCNGTCTVEAGDVAMVFKSQGGIEETIGTSWGAGIAVPAASP